VRGTTCLDQAKTSRIKSCSNALFTDWPAANYARQAEFDLRAARYSAERNVDSGVDIITIESRRRGTN
jgi:hypothetical protein